MAELNAVSQIGYLGALWIHPKGSNTPQALEKRGSQATVMVPSIMADELASGQASQMNFTCKL